jgi:hypothetical protein
MGGDRKNGGHVPKFDEMNETDVREMIVRPLLHRLGYAHGTDANIRTEQTFRYGKAFLGRKDPKKDPDLVGRADYILELAGVGRWVVEAKGPSEPLSQEVVDQAHSYAAHPEVAALFFLITNGRSFRLYRTGALSTPLMAWDHEQTDEIILALSNLVGPDAIRRKTRLLEPDPGKPLAKGVASVTQIIGGYVRYEDHVSNHPLLDMSLINGLELPVTGGRVRRTEDGRLHAQVKVAQSAPMLGELSQLLENGDGYDFFASDEYVSVDRVAPTIFQNLIRSDVPAGTLVAYPGIGRVPLPFSYKSEAATQAVGFIEGDRFLGTMELSYEFVFGPIPPMIRQMLEQQIGRFPEKPFARGGGTFEIHLLNF